MTRFGAKMKETFFGHEITIENGFETYMDEHAFRDCSNLKSCIIPEKEKDDYSSWTSRALNVNKEWK